MQRFLLALSSCLLLAISSCSSLKVGEAIEQSEVFNTSGFTGFMLVDPEKDKPLYALNETLYFVPASNTKLFTFYTSYKLLGEQVNALNYLESGDSLIFWGTGDPSLLHPDIKGGQALELLGKSDKKLYLADNFPQVRANGPGWSWSWYTYYFGAERSALPIYGNVVRFSKANDLSLYPRYFDKLLYPDPAFTGTQPLRKQFENSFLLPLHWPDTAAFQTDKPFITSAHLTASLLRDTLGKAIQVIPYDIVKGRKPKKLPGLGTAQIYKQMMEDSDNFLAEQLLLLVSDLLTDSLSTATAIDYAKKNLLDDLIHEPQWADGSGLSSDNKFTPKSIIELLGKIRAEVPEETIFDVFPAGGTKGTIRSWYKPDEGQPAYIYAKTGTLNNSICLSGYLLTKSGKTLYFSFMHNNYPIPSDDLKREMEKILYRIHQHYK
ncbi:D-alanyl-D-alanine carboxypeptidase [Lunatimonas lonarensis]|uniref:D-alanyl-D-alanine carboxypeptidase n=1 Tax=Lunatimonas lonarensis TaxID=1232681 RepID=R7ZPM2_9BACT|nr:D-alanyl-D-alanine carboxypeptidase [Lunatimonas lonarensis]EON76013.1 D-alanyl-D-alanine carboxypeptidase [Lunatimonas lonarensis]